MCPVCLTTAAMILSGVSSLGGVTGLVVKTIRAKSSPGQIPRNADHEEN